MTIVLQVEESVWADAVCAAVSEQLINDIDWDLGKELSQCTKHRGSVMFKNLTYLMACLRCEYTTTFTLFPSRVLNYTHSMINKRESKNKPKTD